MPNHPSSMPNMRRIAAATALQPEQPPYTQAFLQGLGILGLHCGSGVNLHAAWLNTDVLQLMGANSACSAPGRIAHCGDAYYLQHDAARPFPLSDSCVPRIFAEHFIEHLPNAHAVAWLAEMRRLLEPGGTLRISTPDLEKYVRGYLGKIRAETAEGAESAEKVRTGGQAHFAPRLAQNEPVPDANFFEEHRRQLAAMGIKNVPARRAWMVNQIFFGWEHRWIYDRQEMVHAAVQARFSPDDVRFVSFHRGADAVMAELDLPIRNDESLYVEIVKGQPPRRQGREDNPSQRRPRRRRS